jgi:hypothetical protein
MQVLEPSLCVYQEFNEFFQCIWLLITLFIYQFEQLFIMNICCDHQYEQEHSFNFFNSFHKKQ